MRQPLNVAAAPTGSRPGLLPQRRRVAAAPGQPTRSLQRNCAGHQPAGWAAPPAAAASRRSTRRPAGQHRRGSLAPRALPPGGPNGGQSREERQQRKLDQQIVVGVGLGLTVLVLLALKLGGNVFQEADAFDLGAGTDLSFGAGDGVGALLWAASLYYCSPLQLLLLFFGFVEWERPSDWLLRRMGEAAGLNVDALGYQVPGALQAAAVGVFAASGVAVAAAFQALLGDATWSVSTGLGACMGAALYEAGRPRRLSVEEAQEKERQWQDFQRFADARLQRGGRCHETEILRALGRDLARYRGERALGSSDLRDLVRNWHPEAERSNNGFYKNISLAPAQAASGAAAPAARAPGSPGSGSSEQVPAAAPPGVVTSTDSVDQY